MKHFQIAHHTIAVASIATIVTSLGLAVTATGQAVNSIMLSTDKGKTSDFGKLFTDAIENIVQARLTIEQTFANFRNDGGATEAKNVDHIIDQLVTGGYLQPNSPVVDTVMKQGLETAFSKLDRLADTAVAKLNWARNAIKVNDSDTYLGHTVPTQIAIDNMMSYARELQVIVSSTWRDHNQQPSFVITDQTPVEAKKTVAA
jgi:hypothetical protein